MGIIYIPILDITPVSLQKNILKRKSESVLEKALPVVFRCSIISLSPLEKGEPWDGA